jgi:hypothetical protein
MSMTVPSAITASASRAADLPKAVSSTRVPQWQLDALAYYDQIGAVRYAAQFTARTLAKIRWYPALRDANTGEVKETADPLLTELFDRFQDPGGGRAAMLSTYGQLDFLTGECYLLWTQADPDDEEAEESWEIVSTLELRKQGKRGGLPLWHRVSAPGLTPQELVELDDDAFEPVGDNVRVYRWWRRHPAYSQMADAPMRSVLAECEEIVRATHSINARLISRLAGPGILAIPQSWSLKPLQQVVGEENPEEDPFQARLTEAMITAIGKPGSAESVAPIVVRVPDPANGDMSKVWSLIKVWNADEVIRELELREKAMQRFAVGVDMPPEKVMGLSTSGTQHWNAWMVDEDSWAHVDPVAQAFADNAASSYLRPAAEDAGFAEWKLVCVGYDPAAVLVNPDGFADALKLYDARAVGKAYLRDAGNASDEDAMDDDELAEALFAVTHIEVEVKGGKIVTPEPAAPPVTPISPVAPDGSAPTNGQSPSGQDTPRAAPVTPDGMNASAYRLLGAAEGSVEEIRSRIGFRLRSHLTGRCPDCMKQIEGVRSGLVAATLGYELVMEHGPDLVSLAIDGGRNFVEVAIRMGVSHTQAQALAEVLELHSVSTIYDRAPDLPAGFLGRVRALSGATL